MAAMERWSDQEARWIKQAVEDVIRERRPPRHELTAEEDREVNRLVVNRRLAGEARDLETYRIVQGLLVCLFVESYARWIRGRRRAVVRSMH